MDFEGAVLGFLPDPKPLLTAVADAIALTRAVGGKAGYVRVGFTAAELDAFPAHSAMGHRIKSAGDIFLADAPTTQIHEALAPAAHDFAVRKTRVGAFSTTNLDGQLRKARIKTLILAGVHTSGCVLTTIREAHDRDYQLIVLSDACADPDTDVHTFLVEKVFPKQATVMNSAEYRQIWA